MESQEKATENAKAIQGGGAKGRATVGAVQRGGKKFESPQTTSKLNRSGVSGQGNQSLVCFGCGKPGHRVYSACSLCHRIGHFKAICRSKSNAVVPRKGGGQEHPHRINVSASMPIAPLGSKGQTQD